MAKRLKWSLFLVFVLLSALVLYPRLKVRVRLPTGTGRAKVALGDSHGVILASNSSLWVWGEEDSGWPALGLGRVTSQRYLRQIGTTDWVDVAADGSHTLALKADGTLWGWGENSNWQLGDGTKKPHSTPFHCVAGNDWKQVATGLHCLALKRDGTLWAWGNNWAGVLGNGSTSNSTVPVQVGSSTNWVKVWANNIESVGLQSDGSLWFWGQMLLRFGPKGTNILVPTRLSPDTNWVDVGLGDFMGFAIKSNGTLWAWGADADIYTGASDSAMNATPRQVGTNHDGGPVRRFGIPVRY
jgi:alpha-tubulin suppressor-like RCC1 family protein